MPTYEPYEPPEDDRTPDTPPHDSSPRREHDPFDTRHRPELRLDRPDPRDPQWRGTGAHRPTSGLDANAYPHTSSGVRSGATVAMTAAGVIVALVFALVVGSMASAPDVPRRHLRRRVPPVRRRARRGELAVQRRRVVRPGAQRR